MLELVDEAKHYGDLLGSNAFASTRLGAVTGSRHFGDDVQRWAAFAGKALERDDGKGAVLRDGGVGDAILDFDTPLDRDALPGGPPTALVEAD